MLRLFFVVFILNAYCLKSASVKEGYKALSIYDYFKAKKIFYQNLKSKPAESAYGLAIIFYRTDNPFSNVDSSAKYISKAMCYFKDSTNYSGFSINSKCIYNLSKLIAQKGFEKHVDSINIIGVHFFLTHYYFADSVLKIKAYDTRDNIALNYYSSFNSSDSVLIFQIIYPQSNYKQKAKNIYFDYQYKEHVKHNNEDELKFFISNYPNNPFRLQAELLLFEKIKQDHSPEKLKEYITSYASNNTLDEAWKYLYGLEIKNYDKKSLLNFVSKYPNYPNINIIYQEIELSEIKLIPIKNKYDLYGFVDTTGKWVIKPKYDDAQDFIEGFSAVCVNDSCFFINKNNERLGNIYFNEIESFYNGIAVVKKGNQYYLLNRSGQLISESYEEISSSQNNIYVCKKNGLYGAIDSKANIIIPFVYQKLGDFKNGYSYYKKNRTGLINIKNQTTLDNWDWISDVNTNQHVIVKLNNKFGIINTSGDIILEPKYDLLEECSENIYVVVSNSLYGFYNIKDKCFETTIEYAYKNQLKASEYYQENYFKVFKNNDVGLMDKNGKIIINYGTFQSISFNENNLLKVQKNNKFGFVDYRQKTIIPIDYEYADNFSHSTTIVAKSNTYSILDKSGKVIYSIKNAVLKRLANSIILVEQNDKVGLLNQKGESLVPILYDAYKENNDDSYLFELNDKLYYFHVKYKFLILIDTEELN